MEKIRTVVKVGEDGEPKVIQVNYNEETLAGLIGSKVDVQPLFRGGFQILCDIDEQFGINRTVPKGIFLIGKFENGLLMDMDKDEALEIMRSIDSAELVKMRERNIKWTQRNV